MLLPTLVTFHKQFMQINLRFIQKITSVLKARLAAHVLRRGVSVGYYNVKNFGDQLTPDILKFFGLHPFHISVWRYADVVSVGSILHNLPDDYKGGILGSGFISEKDGKIFSKAKVYLVRGHLTRHILQLSNDTPVGDPGLLSDELYHDAICGIEPKWELGIVPHYIDKNHPSLLPLQKGYSDIIRIIDVERPPREVVRDILMCHRIVSSSLHGLVVADSLGIPNRRIVLSGKTIGGDFKFNDYYSCFGAMPKPILYKEFVNPSGMLKKIRPVNGELVAEVKYGIKKAIHQFVNNHLS